MKKNLSKKIIGSCFLAGCLEMYDFALFGFFVGIFHKNYLSFLDKTNATIVTYMFFAVGFLFRPLGSAIFGYIGDVYGRKKALVASVTFMGMSSLFMSLLPSYNTIGVLSCYIIVFIRIIQGISVGGEYSGALVYAIEHFDEKKKGIVGGIVIAGCISGALLAIIISNLVQLSIFPSYAWRFAFLLGFALSILGYFIRKSLVETPEFESLSKKSKSPLIEGIKKYPRESLVSVILAASNGINFYFILVFLPNHINELTQETIQYYPIITTIILIILSPLFGFISDFFDRYKLIQYGLICLTIYSLLGLQLIKIYNNYIFGIIFFVIHAIIYSSQAATVNILIVEMFPTKYRYSCAAFFYSVGIGVLGGASPLVASLIKKTFVSYNNFFISLYMSFICFAGYIGVYYISKNVKEKRKEINES